MAAFAYNSDLNGGSLMVRESRIIADLLLKNASVDDWTKAIQVENLLQKRSPATARRNAQAIRRRLELMEPEFWQVLRDADDELATQTAFCAALERNLLLVEFMERVMRDAYITRREKLESYLWVDFLEDSAHRDPAIEDWKESTKKTMGQVVFRILAEVGYLKSTRSRKLQPVLIRAEIKAMLDNNDKQRIKDCIEVSYKSH